MFEHNSMKIKAAIFDYGFTLSSEYYFNVNHPEIPSWKELIQEIAFSDSDFNFRWMTGTAKLYHLAQTIHDKTGINIKSIMTHLKEGCKHLKENEQVLKFAQFLKNKNIPTALVTINFDVFTDTIVPNHSYAKLFNTIINSSDYGEIDKTKLWPIAFRMIGNDINYGNSLLIEDCEANINLFRKEGGFAIHYQNDKTFSSEIAKLQYHND